MHVFGPSSEPFVMVRVGLGETDGDVELAEVGFKASDVRAAPVEAHG